MRGCRDLFKIFTCLRSKESVINHRKRSKQITLTILTLLLTVSIVLAVPPTFTETTKNQSLTKTTMVEKRVNSNNDESIMEWNQTYGGTLDDRGWCVLQIGDGGYIIVGSTWSYGAGYFNVWLIKTDPTGDLEWNKTYGGTDGDFGLCVEKTSDGGYIITGYTQSYSANPPFPDVWLIKFSGEDEPSKNITIVVFLLVIGILLLIPILFKIRKKSEEVIEG